MREKIEKTKRVQLSGLPEPLQNATYLGGYVWGNERVWQRELWLDEGADAFCVWEYTLERGLEVGELDGWLSYDEVNEHYPEFGLVKED